MSDTTAHDLAADLVDSLTAYVAEIDAACTIERIYQTVGRPAVECKEIAVWVDSIYPTQGGVQPTDPTQTFCATGTAVVVAWRLATCLTLQEKPLSPAQHEQDAACFDTLAFGLYRRVLLAVGDGDLFTSAPRGCQVTQASELDVEVRQGGTVTGTQLLRVSVPLTRPV